MFYDAVGLTFSTAQAITTTANSTNVVDVTGAGVGNAPAMIGSQGLNTAMGVDLGGGTDGVAAPDLFVTVTTAGTGSGTVTVSLQAAPDNGSYSPGTYTTLYTSGALVGSTLVKGAALVVQVPSILNTLGEALPRFYRLVYTVTGTFTASFTSQIVINPSSLNIGGQYGNNFIAV